MRILYCVGGGVGNLVHTTPTIEAIRGMGHDLTVWVSPEWPEQERIIDHEPVVVGPLPDAKEFDRVFVSPQAFIKRGEQRDWPPGEQSPLPWDRHSEVEVNFWFARALGYDGLMPPPRIRHAEASPVEGEYVVIVPGVQRALGLWEKKQYSRWREVASALCQVNSWPGQTAFVGSQADSEPWMDELGINLCGKTSLWDATGVLFRAKAVVGPDNGPTCLSAAMGRPTVVLWGPTSRIKNRKFGPLVFNLWRQMPCVPCQFAPSEDGRHLKMETCQRPECMEFPPEVVAEAVVRACGEDLA